MLAINITEVVGFLVKNQGNRASKAILINSISEIVYALSYLSKEIIPMVRQTMHVNPVGQEPAPAPFVICAVNTMPVVSVHNNHEKA